MAFVGLAKLNFHLVPPGGVGILEQQGQTAGVGLDAFLVLEDQVAQAQDRGVLGNDVLHPPLVQLRVAFYPDTFWLVVC